MNMKWRSVLTAKLSSPVMPGTSGGDMGLENGGLQVSTLEQSFLFEF